MSDPCDLLNRAIRRHRECNSDWRDTATIADAYLADLAAREATELERAELITEDWLRAIGFEVDDSGDPAFAHIESKFHYVRVLTSQIQLFRQKPDSVWSQCVIVGVRQTTTCGMMLDFLNGLKIPHKTPEIPSAQS